MPEKTKKKTAPKTVDIKQQIRDLSQSDKDTGSSPVQVARLSHRINSLIGHFNVHKKDYHSRYGLLKLVSKRKKLLNYLRRTSPDLYQKTIQTLSLRK